MKAIQIKNLLNDILQNSGVNLDFHYLDKSGAIADDLSINEFERDISHYLSAYKLVVLSESGKPSFIKDLAIEQDKLILVIEERGNDSVPILILPPSKNGKRRSAVYLQNGETKHEDWETTLSGLMRSENPIHCFVIFPLLNIVNEEEEGGDNQPLKPHQRLFRLLKLEKKEIGYIYTYAIAIGLVGLTLPLGIQAIINIISTGSFLTQFWILVSLVLIGLLVVGGLQVMQMVLVELLQRRVFTKAAFEFAFRIPRMRKEAMLNQHAPELVNRFFEVISIQKGLPKFLIDISTAALQIIFGLILLAFYHPVFILFGFFMLLVFISVFYFTAPKGLKTSIIESKYKYKVVYWLEEMARTVNSFKLAPSSLLPLNRTDFHVNHYLEYRSKHFKILLGHYIYVVFFKILVTGGVLVLGSYLVVNKLITLGQFVASEIVIILIIGAAEKLITQIDTVYDLLTAVDKIGNVTDIPLEKASGLRLPKDDKGLAIEAQNLSYTFNDTNDKALNGIDFKIEAGQRVILAGFSNSGKSTLVNILSGYFSNYSGGLTYNGISVRNLRPDSIREKIAKNLSIDEIFDGSIWENITVGRMHITVEEVHKALNTVGLQSWINALPQGVDTPMVSGGKNFSSSIIYRIILARCILKNPGLFILNDFFQNFDKNERDQLFSFLTSKEFPWTIIAVSNLPEHFPLADKIIVLKAGQVTFDGTYAQLKETSIYKDFYPDLN
jgi:ABC-type bacteriocin/lantibiotic exporter with double-glycine peptidase domain